MFSKYSSTFILLIFVTVTGAISAEACRCSNDDEGEGEGEGSSSPTKQGSEHVASTKGGERVIHGPKAVTSSAPPVLPGERRRPRGAPLHPEPTSDDPLETPLTLEQATEGLEGEGELVAVIDANLGRLRCQLSPDKAPRTVANFVGLARGKRPWWDPFVGEWVERPFYDGTNFYRVIPGAKIEGGAAVYAGEIGPGYTLEPEIVESLTHDRAGVLSMALEGDQVSGSKFMILDGPAPHFNGRHPVFGHCEPTDAVYRIARVPQQSGSNRPLTDVVIRSIRIERGD